jgi:uncharacterized protein YjeT (DUF2065 family)
MFLGFFWTRSGENVWHELGMALCLVLVIEGIIPFLYPRRWKEMVLMLADVDDRTMRIVGLSSMLVGTGLLYLIN